jgi:hypothetical protein
MNRTSIGLPKKFVMELTTIEQWHCLKPARLDTQAAATTPVVREADLDRQQSPPDPRKPLHTKVESNPIGIQAPADLITTHTIGIDGEGTAQSNTTAYLLDIFLELHASNWQSAIWKADRPEKNNWFKGRNPITRRIIDEIVRHIPTENISSNNRTIGNHLEAALELIDNDWNEPVVYTKGGLKKVHRTIFGLSQAVIAAAELNCAGRINRGIENPAIKAAKLFQRIAHLPDGLTEEQLVDCLDASWKLYSDKHSGDWST